MLKSQEILIKMSTFRQKANAPETNDADALIARRELNDAETEYRAALQAEGEEVAGQSTDGTLTAEDRERQTITGRADLGVIVGNAISRRNSSGAEAEAQAAWGIEGNQVPMAMIAEMRVVAAPASGGGTLPVSGYVFPASISALANISRPTVPAGTPVFPSIVTSAVAGRPAEAAAHGSTEPTLRGQLLEPHRIQAVASLSVEDRARFPGLGPALAAHLAGAVAMGMDEQAMSDDNGFFATGGPLTAVTPVRTTYAHFVAMVNALDGRHAATPAAMGVLMGADTYAAGGLLYRGNQSDESSVERIARIGRLQVSASVPDPVSNAQNVLVARGSSPAAVQAVWPGLTIEDVYSDSGTGAIGFTAVALAAFSVMHPAAYAWYTATTA